VVADQDDVRRMLVTALQIDGHHVEEANCARDGLRCLQTAHYDLVLSDYSMPGQTGGWMLNEASRQGLLDGTATLIVTAHPDMNEVTDIEVITKPLELDSFLDQVKRILQPSVESGAPTVSSTPNKVELVLYVSPRSPLSMQAQQQLQSVLQGFEPSQVIVQIRDLSADPRAGDDDRVAFTPTLVKRSPAPPLWIVGDLRDRGLVIDLLSACGVDRLTPSILS
jgi:CheY-like chemotaxis protein